MAPKSTRLKKIQSYQNIEDKLNQIPYNKYARQSGFKQRKAKKIQGKFLLESFMFMALQGKNSFQHWAEQLGLLIGRTVSKQGIWKRMSFRFVQFLSLVLADALLQQISFANAQVQKYKFLRNYTRIILHDSTTLSLPSWLFWCFPGNVSRGEKKAQLKIQVVYDLLHHRFIHFGITPYTTNDQSKSKDLLSFSVAGDLVIRDLGYSVLDSFKQMLKRKIFFISRLHSTISISDIQTGKPIDLLKTLIKNGAFDQWVILGKKNQVKVRLVALKLPPEQSAERRRKARQNRDKRLNHSKRYYELLGYNLFITSEDENKLTPAQIQQLYALRWRIEIIFKCWKSHFHLQTLIPYHCSLVKERVEAIVYMMLLFILLFQVHLYLIVQHAAQRAGKGFISLSRLCQYVANHIHLFFDSKNQRKNLNSLIPQILYYCVYDKRHDRKNFEQKLILS